MTFDHFYAIHCDGESTPIKIVDTSYDSDSAKTIVSYITEYNKTPDWFYMNQDLKAYFEPYLRDGQIDSLCGRYFDFDFSICEYDPTDPDRFYDWDSSGNLAVELYRVREVPAEDIPSWW